MADDVGQRVAAAAAFRAHEVAGDRCRDLEERIDRLSHRLCDLRAGLADQRDNERGWLIGVLTTLRHRDEVLGRQRAESEAGTPPGAYRRSPT